eukprot:1138993-Pelagomonas_calceolata.AAC.2
MRNILRASQHPSIWTAGVKSSFLRISGMKEIRRYDYVQAKPAFKGCCLKLLSSFCQQCHRGGQLPCIAGYALSRTPDHPPGLRSPKKGLQLHPQTDFTPILMSS